LLTSAKVRKLMVNIRENVTISIIWWFVSDDSNLELVFRFDELCLDDCSFVFNFAFWKPLSVYIFACKFLPLDLHSFSNFTNNTSELTCHVQYADWLKTPCLPTGKGMSNYHITLKG
jgi:hypothetical protein